MDDNKAISIGKKSFIISLSILLALMIFVGVLSRVIPAGEYDRAIVDGREIIDENSFRFIESTDKLPVYRWFTAPFEVLAGEDSLVIIVIIIFLLFIGGSINILNQSNVLQAIIGKIVIRFSENKYLFMAVMLLIFMSFGAFVGMFEKVIPLIPIVIALCLLFGWDKKVGLGLVLLGSGFGFTAAVSNPFTIGVAQEIAELPIFSGALYRLLIFVVVYTVLFIFLRNYAKKTEDTAAITGNNATAKYQEHANNKKLNRAVIWFASMLAVLFAVLISGSFIPGISDIALPLVGIVFFIGGVGAGLFSGIGAKKTFGSFLKGALEIAPAILLILMASSIKFIIAEAGVMDTILYYVAQTVKSSNPYAAVAVLFGVVFMMDFLIGSGSAKAFLIMPLIVPLADIIGVNRQAMVLAFQFGDGFSNVVFPTNPVLLISLGLASLSYTKWIKWIWKVELAVLLVSLAFLELAVLIGYGPF
ncbi:MAG: YfcC family protein [Clostridia bacterium]|nr:YfcC family protein [Clostridia bacterium]